MIFALVGTTCWAQQPARPALIRQIEAADALARWNEHHPATRPASAEAGVSRLAYDQVFKATVQMQPVRVGAEPEDLAELNDYQLQQALALLHMDNLEKYVQLNRQSLPGANGRDIFSSSENIREALSATSSEPTTRPTRSAILAKYLTPVVIVRTTMDAVSDASQRQDSVDSSQATQLSPEQMVAAIMHGEQVRRAFGVPSTIAPTDLRTPGSAEINPVSPRTLPLSSDVPETMALRADPPGNPSEVVPRREEISRISSTLGVSPDVAELLATGRITLAQAMAGRSSGQDKGTGNPLTVQDPRFSRFYFGSDVGIRDWALFTEDSFGFRPGGGRYVRSDARLNNDPNMRINGQIDRRVNINNDRRTTIQVDPRVNY